MLLPLPILIISAVFLVQCILLLFLRKKLKKIILLTMIPVLAAGAWQGCHEYNRTNKDFSKVKADYRITVSEIIKEYETNDSTADQKYLGKIIELTGNVKKMEQDSDGNYTIVLGETENPTSVRCTMDSTYRMDAALIKEGSSITIRGQCTGYKKNELLGIPLGSDVEITRAAIIKNNK